MSGESSNPTSKKLYWVGWVVSILPSLMLLFSAKVKLFNAEDFAKQMAEMGWPVTVMFGLGIVELTCTILYLIPPTMVLGAILLTGYLGGAVATHVRVADWEHMAVPLAFGVLVWIGAALRDGRLWSLIPWRR